jgi:predicted nuclease of restriction endonuclease-like RecB superfamily
LSAVDIELIRAALVEHADAHRGTDRERDAHALADRLRQDLDEYRHELWQASGRSEGRKRRRSGLGSATRTAD